VATDPGVVGIGRANDVPCLGRPPKKVGPGAAGVPSTCATPATHVLVCNGYGNVDGHAQVVTLVLGMCEKHQPAIEFWAFRLYGQLGDGIVVPADDVQELMRELLGDPDAPEVISPLTGWAPVAATG